ncbi:MAG: hypothetical protein R3E95_08375 [Thiolinea sp.]
MLAAIMVVIWAAVTVACIWMAWRTYHAWLGGFGDEEKTHRIMKDPGRSGRACLVRCCCSEYAALSVVVEQQLVGVLLARYWAAAVLMLF